LSKPSFYILRKPSDPLPGDSDVSPGDVVVMHSGDICVWDGTFWDLLPGRFISVEDLKEFIGYVSSGWPGTPGEIKQDLGDKLPEDFLTRMEKVCAKLQKEIGPRYQLDPGSGLS
jgi:hypothetical protein